MSKRAVLTDWFKPDPIQFRWAKEYLTRKGVDFSYAEAGGYEAGLRLLRTFQPNGTTREEFHRTMRLAWNQHQFKARGIRKTYSFVLKVEIADRLKQLAGPTPKNWIVEDLINEAANTQAEARKTRNATLKEERVNRPVRAKGSDEEVKAVNKAKNLEELLLAQEFMLGRQLFESCRAQVLLEAHGLQDEQLTPPQQEKAQESFKVRQEFLSNELAAHRLKARERRAAEKKDAKFKLTR